VAVVYPARENDVGSGTNSGVFLIACCYLTEMGLGGCEHIVRKLQLWEIVDDCNPDGGPGDVEFVRDSGVNLFAVRLSMCDGVNGADEAFGGFVRPAEECYDCCRDSRMLGTEAHKIEDYAGADGTDGIFAFEVGNEGREDGVGRFDDEAAQYAGGGAADVGVVIGKMGCYAGNLGLEKRQGVSAKSVVWVGAALDGNDAVECKGSDGRVFVIDRLHDVRDNVFYILKRRLAECFGQV
jgi:hypothetical protein